jgi:CheY-like chemotaxis protein
VLNCLSNAVKYTEAGAIRVQLKIHGDRYESASATRGSEFRPKISSGYSCRLSAGFALARQGRRNRSGLYLTRKITHDLLQGTLTVSSEPATEVPLSFPRPCTFPLEPLSRKGFSGMKRVLVIEDNENNMELITFILESNGYEVLKAFCGRDGIAAALRERPEFIILDIQLPDIDATEVLAAIRASEIKDSIPIIAMTSYAMAGDEARLLKADATAILKNP